MSDMTHDEALDAVHQINHKTRELVALLVDLRERNGWKALGFTSWTECLSSDLFTYSRKQLYEFVRAAPVTERLQNAGYVVNHSVANALASYPEEVHVVTMQTVEQLFGKATESNVKRIADLYTQATKTGHIETEHGKQSAFDAAVNLANEEAAKRHEAYKRPITPIPIEPPAQVITGTIYTNRAGLGAMTFSIPDTALMEALKAAPPGTPVSVSLRYCAPVESELDRAARILGGGYLERRIS